MKRRAIFSLSELQAKVEMSLEPYIGVVASIGNYRFLVTAVLENFCYGTALPVQDELGFTLPTEVFARLQCEIGAYLSEAIRRSMGYVWPSHLYGFVMLGDDIIIEEADPKTVGNTQLPGWEETRESLLEAMEDGGFVPERMRRQLG